MSVTIGICGGSASGKSTFANELAQSLGSRDTRILSLDNYYRDFTKSGVSLADINFDIPSSLEIDLMAQHLGMLQRNQTIQSPLYDFATHTRLAESKELKPSKYILVEGLFLFNIPLLAGYFDVRIFIETSEETRLSRRIERDVKSRNRSLKSILDQYNNQVSPMYDEYVLPNKYLANVLVNGEKPFKTQVSAVITFMKKASLHP